MIVINVAGFLTEFTGGQREIKLDSAPPTVGQVLAELWNIHVGLRDRVVNERGEVRPHVNVFLNGDNIRRKQVLQTPLPDGSEITILPSVSGGITEK